MTGAQGLLPLYELALPQLQRPTLLLFSDRLAWKEIICGSEDSFKTRVESNKVACKHISTYEKLFGIYFNLKLSLFSKFVFSTEIGALSVILLT
jgi:hypothetical protein